MSAALLLGLAMALAPTTRGAESGIGLAQASPFLPAGTAAARIGGVNGSDLQLRGIMDSGDGTKYWIYDLKKKKGAWIGLQESGFPFAVVAANTLEGTVQVRIEGGRLELLSLHEAKVGLGESPRVGMLAAVEKPNIAETEVVAEPPPETVDPRWKKLEEETARRALAAAEAARNGQGLR